MRRLTMKRAIGLSTRRALGCAIAAVTFGAVGAAHAETVGAGSKPVTMQVALATKLPSLHNVRWLADSSGVVATRSEPEVPGETIESWSLSGAHESLGSGQFAAPSPDGRWIAFLDGKHWALRERSSGKVTPLGEEGAFAPTVLNTPRWSRDSRYVGIVDILRQPDAPFVPPAEVKDGVRFVDVGAVADGALRAAEDRSRITLIDVRHPQEWRSHLVPEWLAYYGDWGPNGQFYFVAISSWRGDTPTYTVLRRIDARTMGVTEIYRMPNAVMQGAAPRVSPDGKSIALAWDIDTKRWDDFNSLILVDAKTGAVKRLTQKQYVAAASYSWAPDGRSLYFIARHGGLDQVYQVTMDGEVRQLSSGDRRHFDLTLSPDGRWLSYQTEDGNSRKDVRIRSTRDGTERVVTVLSDVSGDYRLAGFKHVKWRSTDGLDIYGYVFTPPDFDPKRKYPLYVDVHGGGPAARLYLSGPLSLAISNTPLEWHAWATLGYVVFVPDMRSSGEYSPTVAAQRYGSRDWDWTGMQKDVEDIESGTRWMIEQGYIDPQRVAVFGHSAGGGRVNLLLTRSSLYHAGIIHDGIQPGALGVMLAFMSGRNTGSGFNEIYLSNGQRIADNPQAFLGGFMFDGYKSHTPTLIMVGNQDKGAVETQSAEVLFTTLRMYHVPARMLRYPDEGHNPLTAASALHRFGEIKAWLEKYIPMPGSATP